MSHTVRCYRKHQVTDTGRLLVPYNVAHGVSTNTGFDSQLFSDRLPRTLNER